MSKRTLFLILALAIITFVLLIMAIYQPQTPETTQVTPTPEKPTAQTVLSFGTPSAKASSSASAISYTVPINISTEKNKVKIVQLELQYDPYLLMDVTATPGSFMKNPTVLLDHIDQETGRVSYALGLESEQEGIMGKGTIANLIFSVKTQTQKKTAIIFLPKTLVTADDLSESALKEAGVGQFILGPEVPTPTSFPTLIPSFSPASSSSGFPIQ